jgi:hypothetical protein
MRFRAALLIGALLVVATAGSVFGQGFQGGLRGAIKDAGGVIPGVEVTLTNEQTNIKRSSVTNERGEYVFANIDPATYSVKATLQGYKTVDRGDIRIGTQQFLTLDLTMEVGAITENVTVTGQAPLIETSNASTGTVLDSAALNTLPAPGRAAFMMGASVPTVVASGDTQFNRQQDQTNISLTSLGGGTRRGNNYVLDGVPITDMRNRQSANPSIEALDDVKVQVHTYDAEMGRTGGGVFNTTLKSGTNMFHGAGFYQTRPVWGQVNNYFSALANQPKPDSVYYLPGGGFGGPIRKDKTFFWFASEDYHDVSTRNVSVTLPTIAEQNGDFSGLVNAAGARVTIYDPLTHLPFPGNIIPTNRINPVSAAMLKYLPTPDTNIDNGSANYTRTAQIVDQFQQEYALKIEHKFTDKVSLSGFYLYNRTNEPCADYFTPGLNGATRAADPLDYILQRRPQILALNNTWVLNDSSVLALRFGMTRFPDNNTLSIPFDPTTLPFSSTYASQIALQKFPSVDVTGYDQSGLMLGAINPTQINYKSTSANAAYSKFVGTHTFKLGGDFRKIYMDSLIPGNGAGSFIFDKEFTSATGNNNSSATDGNGFASFLLGYPSGDPARLSTLTTTTPLNMFTYYYGGYVQDDWRVNSKFTLNYGLRLEHESGLAEQNNNVTVGFDPNASLGGAGVTIPADPVAGTPARVVTGGLMYAGVNGNKTEQGNQPAVKWSPRVGAVYSITSNTVLRAGYGVFWAPWNYPAPSASTSNYGQVGYTQNTNSTQTATTPTLSFANMFPLGVQQPTGNSKGALSGLDTTISYVDQNHTAPRVQQYSGDLQHELPGSQSITLSYVGARGDHLPLGGSNDTPVNINQLDPKYQSLTAAQLAQALPNPFFGNPNVPLSLSTPTTLTRQRLLRPFPQFANINDRQVSEGLNRYNAVVIEWSKRVTHGWGGRMSYTYSNLQDNQVGETNFYSSNSAGLPLNNYNYIASAPACQPGQQLTTACYDPRAEYTTSLIDVPHRFIFAPIVELPFGTGRKWGTNAGGLANTILGGWTVAAVTNIQSGFPINVNQSDNSGTLSGSQRPNLVSGVDIATTGSYADRLASADHSTATWINPAAFTLAAANTFGNAPRTLPGVRTPIQANTDVSFIKNVRLTGRTTGQLKVEMLNIFNRVITRGLQGASTFGNSNFGQDTIQAGFMRIAQIMFRIQF